MSAPVDVLAVMDAVSGILRINATFDPQRQNEAARDAVAELIKCCEVTVKAFEALGRTDNIVAQLESHRECERALVEQKAALARVGGA